VGWYTIRPVAFPWLCRLYGDMKKSSNRLRAFDGTEKTPRAIRGVDTITEPIVAIGPYHAAVTENGSLVLQQATTAGGLLICLDCGKPVGEDDGRLNWFDWAGRMVLWRGHRRKCT
jgi:hypothetical protein